MASIEDLQKALTSMFYRIGNPYQGGSFFETRTTKTPGMVTPLDGAGGQYVAEHDPYKVVMGNSSLEPAVRNQLAQMWADKGNGFIAVAPNNVGPTTFAHEQLHRVWDKGQLASQAAKISPMLDTGWKNYVAGNPIYSGISPERLSDEALAYQLSASKNNDALINAVAGMLNSKGKSAQAEQLRKLAK